ncbi:MAG TPA: hypothetical protein VFY49_10070 [Myxococcota bacterium]|nr:hypothetical protein [Myxococcota bacterium]
MTSMVQEMVESVTSLDRPRIEKQLARARARFDDLDVQVRKLVQERPVAAVGAALLFGYALGRLLLRRR